MDAQAEWELLAMKAVSWLHAQKGNNTNNTFLFLMCLKSAVCLPLVFSAHDLFVFYLLAPCVTECVEAGNALLGCSVQKDALGL